MKINILITSLLTLSTLATTELDSRQWSVKNDGQKYTRRVGEYNREVVHATPGIDINAAKNISKLEKEGKSIVVAVIDSGLDIEHEDIKASLWENPVCKNIVGEDRFKYPCHGINILTNTSDLSDKLGHGTFIAGQIAATNNELGITGAAHSKIKIMGIKALDDKFSGFTSDGKLTSELIANGVIFATKNGASVVNLSMGFPKIVITPKVKAAFDYAMDNGVVIVAAAGNNNKNKPVFPCNYSRVICVGGIDGNGDKVVSSNFGQKVDIYAPGENIISTIPTGMESEILRINKYDVKTGTSYAAPYVAALAGMLKSQDPSLSVAKVREIILNSARSVNGLRLIDYDAALARKYNNFLDVNLKNVDEVTVDGTSFSFKFDFASLLPIAEENLALTYNTSEIKELSISVVENEMIIKGHVRDLNINSNQSLSVAVSADTKIQNIDIEIDLNINASKQEKKLITKIPAKAILTINPAVKRSSLQRVLIRNSNKVAQDMFFVDGGNKKRIYLLKEESRTMDPILLNLEEDSAISAIMKYDANFDGKDDYFVYGATADKKSYFFAFFDEDGKPLFEKNYWKFKASRFEGLSFTRGFENFSYLKLKTEFGIVKLPVFERNWSMPFEDNGLDPIDRQANSIEKRAYFLLPETNEEGGVDLKIRTLNSDKNMRSLIARLDIEEFEEINMSEVVLQSESELVKGAVNVVVNYGVGYNKKTALVKFYDAETFSIIKKSTTNTFGNDFMRPKSFENIFSDDINFSTVFSRNFIRFGNLDGKKLKFDSGSWSDLLISTIDIIDGKEKGMTYFLESRYNVFAIQVDSDGIMTQSKLPVDRESGYPGFAFSQSFQSVLLSDGSAGVFTDTKSIYGDTVGVLKFVDGKLIKPLQSNYTIPADCVSLGVTEVSGKAFLQMHCGNAQNSWISRVEL
ncbi:S8 family serine peptidase [Bacteriovorax sp. Seq25_V]|uniref:S8 family peptidase n=1 Tax=Bacteriovorax sp. Seq25_V TaxID=1201288 RepID=UPI000389F210|nr:S8 family serine peptidase [Bacteriovorax sp. Seq25_V]EQC44896.1 peptidase, S8/S53 family [Bacteriovorax sp. Seq25_V]